MMRHHRYLFAFFVCASVSVGCVMLNPDGNARTDLSMINLPSGADFKPVGLFLGHRCGTLDCHGQVGRNLRIYGREGLRLSPMDQPGGLPTTPEELDADYRSAVALEPEIMLVVVAGAAPPDALTLIRKPRGEEHHKGGTVITVGDDQDNCMTSWLAGNVDTTACANALKYP
jgi:hypothetical protein